MRHSERLRERARGRWTGILPSVGISASYLTGKHGPCPLCREGSDRFRFDNKDGLGTWICSVCGAGDGIKLVIQVLGLEFKDAAKEIEEHLGEAPVEVASTGQSDADRRQAMNAVWTRSTKIVAGDAVARWLEGRVGATSFPSCLRTARQLRYTGDTPSWHPGMIAMVTGADGKPATLHRTYLTLDGQKAPVDEPRRFMPGAVPKGSAIRLADYTSVLGIAEGIETALAAKALFGVPCWSAINTSLLAQWEPPGDVQEIIIFGDNDGTFAGQAAAYGLAKRIAKIARSVEVRTPEMIGQDWNDVWLAKVKERTSA